MTPAEAAIRDSNVVNNLMRLPEGRSWMYDFLETCHIGMTPFDRDPIVMAHHCGEMNIGMRVWSQLQDHCPEQYILMMQERKALDDARRARDAAERADNPDNGHGDSNPDGRWDPNYPAPLPPQ